MLEEIRLATLAASPVYDSVARPVAMNVRLEHPAT